jgi:hypothetical protein
VVQVEYLEHLPQMVLILYSQPSLLLAAAKVVVKAVTLVALVALAAVVTQTMGQAQQERQIKALRVVM